MIDIALDFILFSARAALPTERYSAFRRKLCFEEMTVAFAVSRETRMRI
jgi:hypothetical protein